MPIVKTARQAPRQGVTLPEVEPPIAADLEAAIRVGAVYALMKSRAGCCPAACITIANHPR